ncbi:alpha/beta hydrolase [Falsiroseomonas bella]|uniref:Alpha/beta hydrolase n=1 Tax=Falsiroseomonas bella TaxID=2184016 RepID=A0A317FF85_9PROT|nr:alpha/beta fold hydrolase [Falsiroseomonas bella]PWS37751.1 alpha/beta hydrolase [Falsiroseomonas bella]
MTDGTTLLLLPGLLCDARLWRDQAAALGAVLPCRIADLTHDDSIGGMAGRALAAVPGEGPLAVCGLSMGGYVAFEIWRRAPHRVARIALFDTSARPDTEEQTRRRRALLALSESGMFRGVTPRLLPQLLHPDHLAGPLAAEVMAMAERVGRPAFHRQQRAIMHRADSRPDLPRIAIPALVAVGEGDTLTPPHLAEEMAAGIPGARLARIPGAGHLPSMEKPEAVTALLREWLDA